MAADRQSQALSAHDARIRSSGKENMADSEQFTVQAGWGCTRCGHQWATVSNVDHLSELDCPRCRCAFVALRVVMRCCEPEGVQSGVGLSATA